VDRDRWNRRYAGTELIWTADANRFLVTEARELAPGRALDVACGEGRNAVWLAERGWKVTGVDFSDVGLAKAARLAAERGVSVDWIHADVLEYVPPPGAFDLVIVFYLHVAAAARREVLARAAGAVSGGGRLLVVGHDTSNPAEGHGGPQDPTILFTADDLAGELPGLTIERAERVRRPVASADEGVVALDALVRAVRKPGSPG
jgi:SAM-dependent methyltransferase